MSVVWIRGQFLLRGVWLSCAFSNYFCCYIYEDKVCINMVFHQYASSCVGKSNKVSSWQQRNFYMDIPKLHLWSLLALSAKKYDEVLKTVLPTCCLNLICYEIWFHGKNCEIEFPTNYFKVVFMEKFYKSNDATFLDFDFTEKCNFSYIQFRKKKKLVFTLSVHFRQFF